MVSPLPSIITLAQAKRAARITLPDDDADLYLRLEASHETVLEYVNNRLGDTSEDWTSEIAEWNADTAPKGVKAAILQMFCHLSRFRGDDPDKAGPRPNPDGDLPEEVKLYLKKFRDPSVA